MDATTNRLNSLLFKVKPELSDGDLQLCWHPNIKQFLFWAGEISSHEWLLCTEPLWNCMWEAWYILWTRLWGSLVWFSIMPGNCCSGRQMIDICFSFASGMWQVVLWLLQKLEDLCMIRKWLHPQLSIFYKLIWIGNISSFRCSVHCCRQLQVNNIHPFVDILRTCIWHFIIYKILLTSKVGCNFLHQIW